MQAPGSGGSWMTEARMLIMGFFKRFQVFSLGGGSRGQIKPFSF
jgi:hypothetical protein